MILFLVYKTLHKFIKDYNKHYENALHRPSRFNNAC